MNYSKIYPLVKKTPRPIRNAVIKTVNRVRLAKVKRLETPRSLVYFVTNKCNARCQHCFYMLEIAQKTMKEMTLKEIDKVTKSMGPVNTLALTGGEATLRPDLESIIRTFYDNTGVRKITLPTNGFSTNRVVEIAEYVGKNLPDLELHVQISLDGMEKFHDKFRRVKGIFKNACETAKKIKEMEKEYPNLSTYIISTITGENIDEIFRLIDFAKKELKIDHKLQVVRGANYSVWDILKNILSDFDPNYNPKDNVTIPKPEQLWALYDEICKFDYKDPLYHEIQKLKLKYSIEMMENPDEYRKTRVKCLAGKLDGVLYPNGDIAMCEMTNVVANVRDFNHDFKKAWNSEEANKMRGKITRCFCTHSCNLVNSMQYDDKTLIRMADS